MYYDFINIRTKKEFRLEMRMAELEPYLAKNKNVRQVFKSLNMGDAVRLGITKPDAYYQKHVIDRIRKTVPGARQDSKFSVPREW